MKQPSAFASYIFIEFVNINDVLMEGAFPSVGTPNPFERILTNEDLDWELNLKVEEILSLHHSHHSPKSSNFERLEYDYGTKTKPSVEEPLELDLKPLLSNLKYVFLNPPFYLPIVIVT